jgi:hypothetical protein
MADPTPKDVVAAISKLDAKFDQLDSKVEQLVGDMNERFDNIDARFDKVDERFDALLDKLRASSLVHKDIAKRLGIQGPSSANLSTPDAPRAISRVRCQ